jgi:uncharacterized protein YprB with RNaseH-like and TPR domain
MIESTFLLLNGIGEVTERKLWGYGVTRWQDFQTAPSLPGIGRNRKTLYDEDLSLALHHYELDDARYFGRCLKARDHWRLYDWLRPRAVYLDIETAGGPFGDVTVVGLYAGGRMTSLVRGDSLTQERLCAELSQYDLVVTFFGAAFDLPYLLATYPKLTFDQPHIDLCFLARRLGLRGGLKYIEAVLGIERQACLHGLNGWDAVRLWNRWRHGHDTRSLELLLGYNAADAMNLRQLADFLFDRLAQQCEPFRAPS